MPNGIVAPGKTFPPFVVPTSGFTSDARSCASALRHIPTTITVINTALSLHNIGIRITRHISVDYDIHLGRVSMANIPDHPRHFPASVTFARKPHLTSGHLQAHGAQHLQLRPNPRQTHRQPRKAVDTPRLPRRWRHCRGIRGFAGSAQISRNSDRRRCPKNSRHTRRSHCRQLQQRWPRVGPRNRHQDCEDRWRMAPSTRQKLLRHCPPG